MIPAILASVAGGILSGVMQKVTGSSGSTDTGPSQTLGKDDFLRLLTTQLRNQDPLNPMDNTAFVAQTAQFSSLEQLQNMNSTLQQLTTQMGGAGPASAAALLGRVVTANGSAIHLETGRQSSLTYALPGAAGSVAVQVQDETGKAVRTLLLGPQGGGTHQVAFDGLDDQGRPLPSGDYSFRVGATDSAGRAMPGVFTGGGQVTGISMENGQLVLLVGDQRVPLTSVVSVTGVMAQ
ncbi:MAG TPA: flagellar hook capping FlgD N-terminal domain-containing protein [Candidatus Methylomirabilis sp.]|nr:flagellar hook capping FlgD N-terminal domain-containing protein [Candidatus Methylomirabilis sp.]